MKLKNIVGLALIIFAMSVVVIFYFGLLRV